MLKPRSFFTVSQILFLMGSMISFAQVTRESEILFSTLRLPILFLCVAFSGAALLSGRIDRRPIFGLFLVVSFYIVGLLHGLSSLWVVDFLPYFAISFVMVTVGVFLFAANPAQCVARRYYDVLANGRYGAYSTGLRPPSLLRSSATLATRAEVSSLVRHRPIALTRINGLVTLDTLNRVIKECIEGSRVRAGEQVTFAVPVTR